ncbi:zinc-binding alcohol dehydrogenase family protein [Pelagibacterium lentulum]|uniref:Alcohol dehydrogenase n=1 Tax=Pelagibacterium lentulum TaxID=2029865 RepID=A0A916RAX3_9HYPH|nr:zinc-binding alcohol dehydrogenase family protein [Pelagibacterium lentulum]GGA42881.1 alcohol dehydrogenase [Pelagibacterium lentulum]
MKTLVCEQPGTLRLEDRAFPQSPGEGWVPVDISHVGICGTDYHIFEGKHPYLQYPRVMGHELSGRVAENAGALSKGDLVIVNPYVACGTCRACLRGKPNCCYNIGVLGVHRDGGMCERIYVPAENLYPAPGLEPYQAAMVEFLAIGAHAVRRSEVEENDRVLVVGVGPIGLGVALFARLRGAQVHLLDSSRKRLEMIAEKFEFDSAMSVDRGADAVMAPTDGEGYDVVFDATGNANAIEAGFAYVAHGGTYVLVSVVTETVTFADPEFHKREMKLVGSRNATREDFETVIATLKAGEIDTKSVHTHSARLDTLANQFNDLLENRDTVIKAIVEVS